MVNSNLYLSFHACEGIGPKTFALILKAFNNDLEKAWKASTKDWKQIGFKDSIVAKLEKHKKDFDLDKLKETIKKKNISYLPQSDPQFPQRLKEIADCPIGLFIKGQLLPQDAKAVAVVGTRKMTPYGHEVTQQFTAQLVHKGFTIISGLALGIDGVAHTTALEHNGRTIAVLGCGVDIIYPSQHRQIASQIEKNGALISEYLPGTKPIPGNFPARNRIVSGLSLGVLVTEGASRSGSKITALLALDQNREVFAVPGSITNPMASAPLELIQKGAKLVLNVDNILEELPVAVNKGDDKPPKKVELSDPNQQKIWNQILSGNRHLNDITRLTKLPISTVTTALTMLELQGLIKRVGEGEYILQ